LRPEAVKRPNQVDQPIRRWNVLGSPVDSVTMSEAVSCAERFIRNGGTHQLIAINALKVVLADQRPEFRKILWDSELAFVDGKPVVFASRLLGSRLPELISGHFLMEHLIAMAEERQYSVYFLGAAERVVSQLVTVVKDRHPKLRIAGWRNGFWKPEQERDVVRSVRESGAQMLFLALGTPQKEEWIHRFRSELNVPVCMGVGGSFDVVAGFQKVEPRWIRNAGLAWLFRLVQEPRRLWKRYASTNPVFLRMLFGEIYCRLLNKPRYPNTTEY
jgi:N-acetylglucosaminyldiphosphoundecaprenol N-acetyl-beta-D-mannosaminyltransferase